MTDSLASERLADMRERGPVNREALGVPPAGRPRADCGRAAEDIPDERLYVTGQLCLMACGSKATFL
jgi:hypothetical protein